MGSTIAYHVVKHKKQAINGLQRHDERKPGKRHSNKNIKFEKTKNNIFLKTDNRTYQQRFEFELEKRYKAKRRPRSDAVALVSQTVQFGGDLSSKSDEEQVEVLVFCSDWLRDRFGEENTISSVIHLDESNPHLHISYIPLTSDGRLSAKEYTSRQGLREVQAELLQAVQRKFPKHVFGRADEQGRGFANGQAQKDFERLSKKRDEVLEGSEELAKTVERFKGKVREVADEQAQRERELVSRDSLVSAKVAKLETAVKEYKKRAHQETKKIKERKSELVRFEAELLDLSEELKSQKEYFDLEVKLFEKREKEFLEEFSRLEAFRLRVVEMFSELIERAKTSLPARRVVTKLHRDYLPVTEENYEDLGKELGDALALLNVESKKKEKNLGI